MRATLCRQKKNEGGRDGWREGGRGYWKRQLGGREGGDQEGIMRQFYWNTKIKDRPLGDDRSDSRK